MYTLGGQLVFWCLISRISTQCELSDVSSTRPGNLRWVNTDVNFQELTVALLTYCSLVQEQIWFTKGNITITQRGDPTCALLSPGIPIDTLDQLVAANVSVPVMTSAHILQDKIIFESAGKLSIVNKEDFNYIVTFLGLIDMINLDGHQRIVFLISNHQKILTNFNINDRNGCKLNAVQSNTQLSLSRVIEKLQVIWEKTISLAQLMSMDSTLNTFFTCLQLPDMSLDLLLLKDSLLSLSACKDLFLIAREAKEILE